MSVGIVFWLTYFYLLYSVDSFLDCSHGARYVNTCLWLDNTEVTSFDDANARCSDATPGGSLVVIENEEKQDVVWTVLGTANAWIGIQNEDELLTWVDGTAVTFQNWMSSPSNCAYFDYGFEIWMSIPCVGAAPKQALCQWKPAVAVTTSSSYRVAFLSQVVDSDAELVPVSSRTECAMVCTAHGGCEGFNIIQVTVYTYNCQVIMTYDTGATNMQTESVVYQKVM